MSLDETQATRNHWKGLSEYPLLSTVLDARVFIYKSRNYYGQIQMCWRILDSTNSFGRSNSSWNSDRLRIFFEGTCAWSISSEICFQDSSIKLIVQFLLFNRYSSKPELLEPDNRVDKKRRNAFCHLRTNERCYRRSRQFWCPSDNFDTEQCDGSVVSADGWRCAIYWTETK